MDILKKMLSRYPLFDLWISIIQLEFGYPYNTFRDLYDSISGYPLIKFRISQYHDDYWISIIVIKDIQISNYR